MLIEVINGAQKSRNDASDMFQEIERLRRDVCVCVRRHEVLKSQKCSNDKSSLSIGSPFSHRMDGLSGRLHSALMGFNGSEEVFKQKGLFKKTLKGSVQLLLSLFSHKCVYP